MTPVLVTGLPHPGKGVADQTTGFQTGLDTDEETGKPEGFPVRSAMAN